MKNPKKIILCFDGTSNEFGENNTNIVKIYKAIQKDSEDQISFYDPGVGTIGPSNWAKAGAWLYQMFAQVTGYGISENIKDGYRFLMDNYENGDQVYIFGFSRGAYTARSLAGMIGRVGVLRKGLDNQIDYAYKMYSDKRNHPHAEGFKFTFGRDCNVKMIGVFDTVGALMGEKAGMALGFVAGGLIGYYGFPYIAELLNFDSLSRNQLALLGVLLMMLPKNYIGRFFEKRILGSHHFHDTKLSNKVEYGIHALALHEKRWLFQPTRWDLSNTLPNQILEQVWFSGVHSDVGGYNPKYASTSDNALAWMLHYAQLAGLRLNQDFMDNLNPDPKGDLSMNPWLWSLLGPITRKVPREDKIHISVKIRSNPNSIEKYPLEKSIPYDTSLVLKRDTFSKIRESWLKGIWKFISK